MLPSIEKEPPTLISGPEKKRLRLLDAAAEHFAKVGYSKTTIEEIAQTAGVSKGLLYVHYKCKEELLEAVLARTLAQWRDEIQPAVEKELTVSGALQTMHLASIAYASAQPLLRRILAEDARLVRSLVSELSRSAQTEWFDALRELLQEGKRSGEFRPDLDIECALSSYCLLHLSFLDRLTDREGLQVNDPQLIAGAIRYLLDGFCTRTVTLSNASNS